VALGLFLALTACATPSAPSERTSSATTPEPGTPAASTTSATPTVGPPVSAVPTGPADPLEWLPLELAGDAPAAREDHTWTVGSDGLAYLFGGRADATVHGDLWALDLATDTWIPLDPAGARPAPRFGHEAEWVDGVGLVVFAGQAGSDFFGDLWAYDPGAAAWRELPSGGDAPVPRYGTCAAVGPDGRLWVSHGFTADGTRFSDTRAYDFAAGAWADETPPDGRPVERCLHGCWWTDDGRLALYAGQTTGVTALDDRWSLDPAAGWSVLDGAVPPARNRYAHVRDHGETWVFGGEGGDGSALGDLWRLGDDGSVRAADPATGIAPAPRWGAELILDTEGDRLLLFGGRDPEGVMGDAWEFVGG
jgi:hypothetical protein